MGSLALDVNAKLDPPSLSAGQMEIGGLAEDDPARPCPFLFDHVAYGHAFARLFLHHRYQIEIAVEFDVVSLDCLGSIDHGRQSAFHIAGASTKENP